MIVGTIVLIGVGAGDRRWPHPGPLGAAAPRALARSSPSPRSISSTSPYSRFCAPRSAISRSTAWCSARCAAEARCGRATSIWLYISNIVAILVTLGLATAWVTVRMARYRARNLCLIGDGTPESFVGRTATDSQRDRLRGQRSVRRGRVAMTAFDGVLFDGDSRGGIAGTGRGARRRGVDHERDRNVTHHRSRSDPR